MEILTAKKIDIKKAAHYLLNGQLVAFPTETVYGVACIFDNENSYRALNKLKRRAPNKPYTLMCANLNDVKKYARVNDKQMRFLKQFMPGSLTVLLPAQKDLPLHTYQNGIVGIRIPSNKIALELLKAVGKPLLVPSLNRSQESPISDIAIIKKTFNQELDAAIVGTIEDNIPSTVIAFTDNDIKIIREGKIPSRILKEEYYKL